MAVRNSNRLSRSVKIRAVAYIRRSTTNHQEQSLEGQRRDIERWAEENGYEIVRWYEDDGISGDATEKRIGFRQMHHDATNGRDFDVILCWDLSRFGRFDSIEAGQWINPLRRAGVRLLTVKDGPADWTSFEGRVMSAINSEAKHQYILGIADSAPRGMIQRAEKGHLCGQAAPYGFDRIEVDETGQHQGRLRPGERAKSRKSHITLVPSDDPLKVKTLKWIFKTYAETDVGVRALAASLNERGIPSPGSDRRDRAGNPISDGQWWLGTVRDILRNEVYCGDFIWAKRRIGKYRRVAAGVVKERELELTKNGTCAVKRNVREEWTIVKDAHAALVDRATFERVQEKLTRRKLSTTPKKNGDRYLLSGLVRCGHCGAKMYGTRGTKRARGSERRGTVATVYEYHKYICSTYNNKGKTECKHHAIDQRVLTDFIIRQLQIALLDGQTKDELRACIRKQLAVKVAPAEPGQVESLKKKLAECNRRVEKWTENVLDADPDVKDLLSAKLSGLRKERDRLADDLAKMDRVTAKPKQPTDLDAEAERIAGHLWTLADDLHRAEPARVRELFNRMVESVELWFDHIPRGKQTICQLSNGILHLRPDPLIFRLVSRGDRIRTCDIQLPKLAL
jgi:site-specific DNA recombinase